MKRTIIKTSIAIFLLAAWSTGFAQVPVTQGKEAPVQIKFIGNVENQPLFQLSLNSNDKSIYYVTIKDDNDEIIYSERIPGTVTSRKYLLDIDQADLNNAHFKLTFEITDKKSKHPAVFNVTKSIKRIEEILVAKL